MSETFGESAEFNKFSTFDTSGKSADSVNRGGRVDQAGKHHFMVESHSCEGGKTDLKSVCVAPQLEILASSVESQVGKRIYHRVWLAKAVKDKDKVPTGEFTPPTPGGLDVILRFALGMELITRDDIGKPDLQIPWELLDGRQGFCETVEEQQEKWKNGEPTGEFGPVWVIPYGRVYRMDDEHCEDWPRDMSAPKVDPGGAPSAGDMSDLDGINSELDNI